MGQCLTGNGGSAKITLERCSLNQDNQIWTMNPETTTIRQSGQCMDLNTGRLQNNRADLIRYSCTGGANHTLDEFNSKSKSIIGLFKFRQI